MRYLKYDPTGIKSKIVDYLDPLLKGTSSFSYHRNPAAALPYLNQNHDLWNNPMDPSLQSTASFMELYDKALEDGASIVDQLEALCQKGIIHQDDVYSIIPNIASTHGLSCNQKLKIKSIK